MTNIQTPQPEPSVSMPGPWTEPAWRKETDQSVAGAEPAASATLEDMTTGERRRGYGALWRTVPQELGFLLLAMPIAILGVNVVAPLFFAGVGAIPIVIGLFVAVGSLYVARAFGTLELLRLRGSGRPPIPRPSWRRPGEASGFWRTVLAPMTKGHYWVYLLHTMIVNPIVSVVSWSVTIAWTSVALGGTTYWIWAWSLPQGDRDFYVSRFVLERITEEPVDLDPFSLDLAFFFVVGVLFVVTLPFITRGFTRLHDAVARGMLSRWRSDDLAEQVTSLDASRGAAVAAEDQAIRRLERDIHDGPQQRLIRLQMDLAAAERKLDSDPAAARALIAEATSQAHASLDELRALSRGFAPPLLLDRGLVEAVRSSAALNPLRVVFETNIDASTRFPGEIERNAYFIVAELLTNAAKHSGGTEASVRLTIGDADAMGRRALWIEVGDNGRGGASFVESHGLAGLRDRVSGLRGSLTVESTPGRGTRVIAFVPLP